jgi:hypothetical protein
MSINEYFTVVNLHDLCDSTSTRVLFIFLGTLCNKVKVCPLCKELPYALENSTTLYTSCDPSIEFIVILYNLQSSHPTIYSVMGHLEELI